MIRKATFSNGLTLLTESMPDVRSVCLGVWLRRGSRDEPRSINGICHFIEHLVFKGTESRSAREIALAMDAIGGQMDAFTSKEYTCFYAKVLDEHLDDAVDLLADIVQNPSFDPTELERERRVVLEEIRMVEDTPEELLYDLFSERFYPTHPLGRPIQGTEKTVGSMSRRRLMGFFREAYAPSNLLIVAAGNLRHGNVSKRVRRAFAGLEGRRQRRTKPARPKPRPTVALREKPDLEQVHLLLGLPAFPGTIPRRYTYHVLNTLLGGTMSSRLFQRVREERGLAYNVYSGLSLFSDSGVLSLYAATSPSRAVEAIEVIVAELRSLAEHGPTEDEVQVAKENLKGSLMLSLESTSNRMSNLARQEIYFGRQIGPSETLRGIDGVTRARIRRAARDLFSGQKLALAAVGRVDGLDLRPRELVL